ncbi:hypothetical protein GJ744_010359 [Endocarpon pusillum]|uniref:Uncharacterized protein n=1 Tax=Endocarpon pusillum TaxID=364733 RepID=A0A8H7E484_9EURO|nr:hypothetical protein GJ744_010359 [Endocarpon pusillum]
MANLPPTQSVWALQETAGGLIAFTKGLLQAATSDNVSPIALAACQSFGSLLPICPETRLKIGLLARRSHTSHVLKFVSAQIGYLKGDSVEILSESDGGLRFLSLVATFCTMSRYEAAIRIDSLLEATQSRDQLRPTLVQVQSMMRILESKLALSDFAANVAGWEIWFISQLLRPADDLFRPRKGLAAIPPQGKLQDLILLLNETSRLGEEQGAHIRSSPEYVPWLVAFIKWLVGEPPFIQLATGRILNHQDKPRILLTILENSQDDHLAEQMRNSVRKNQTTDLQVSASHMNKKLRNLVIDEMPKSEMAWFGMLPVREWTTSQVRRLFNEYPQLQSNRELLEVLEIIISFIVGILPDQLSVERQSFERREDREFVYRNAADKVSTMKSLFHCTAFPEARERIALVQELLGAHITVDPIDSTSDRISRLEGLRSIIEKELPAKAEDFITSIGYLGAELAFFSLFGTNIEALPLVESRFSPDPTDSWEATVLRKCQNVIYDVDYASVCSIDAIMQHATNRLGQRPVAKDTIISSNRGQVIYPAFFESSNFMAKGYLQLCVFPGFLNMNGMRFDRMIDEWDHMRDTQKRPNIFRDEIASLDAEEHQLRVPATFIPPRPTDSLQIPMRWRTSVYDDVLQGTLVLDDRRNDNLAGWILVQIMDYVQLTPPCQHKPDSPAGDLAEHFYLNEEFTRDQFIPHPEKFRGDQFTPLLLLSGRRGYGRQLYKLAQLRSLSSFWEIQKVIVHFEGCIRCALQLCLDGGHMVVIC